MAKRPELPDALRYIEASDASREFPGRLSYALKEYVGESAKADNFVIVREVDEEIVGVAWIACEPGLITVHHLETDPDYEGGGVGSLLLLAIEKKFAPVYDATRIDLNALNDEDLVAWYGRRGFEIVGPTRDEPGYGPVVPMRKKLA